MKLTEEQLDALALSAFPDNIDSRGIYRAGLKQMNGYFGGFDAVSFKEWSAKLNQLCFEKFCSLTKLNYSSIAYYREYLGYEIIDQFTVKINFSTKFWGYDNQKNSINFDLETLLYTQPIENSPSN